MKDLWEKLEMYDENDLLPILDNAVVSNQYMTSAAAMYLMQTRNIGPAKNAKIMWYTWLMLAITITFILTIGIVSAIKSQIFYPS
jgi:hypothetical protein